MISPARVSHKQWKLHQYSKGVRKKGRGDASPSGYIVSFASFRMHFLLVLNYVHYNFPDPRIQTLSQVTKRGNKLTPLDLHGLLSWLDLLLCVGLQRFLDCIGFTQIVLPIDYSRYCLHSVSDATEYRFSKR